MATVLGAPLAVAAGWLLATQRFPGRALLTTALFLPLVLPPVVTGVLLLEVLGRGGFLEGVAFTRTAAVVAACVVGLPLFTLAARQAFEAVDPAYVELAQSLGVRPWRVFSRVTLPLAAPGLAAGAVLTFARALGEFGATAVVAGNVEGETRTIALEVWTLLAAPGGEERMAFLVWCSVGAGAAAVMVYETFRQWQRRRMELE